MKTRMRITGGLITPRLRDLLQHPIAGDGRHGCEQIEYVAFDGLRQSWLRSNRSMNDTLFLTSVV